MQETLNRRHLVNKIAADSGYYKQEVNDILLSLYKIIRLELEEGNRINLDGIGKLHLARPKRRFICKKQVNDSWLLTDGAPKIKFTGNDTLARYLMQSKHNVKAFVDHEPSIFRITRRISNQLSNDDESSGTPADHP